MADLAADRPALLRLGEIAIAVAAILLLVVVLVWLRNKPRLSGSLELSWLAQGPLGPNDVLSMQGTIPLWGWRRRIGGKLAQHGSPGVAVTAPGSGFVRCRNITTGKSTDRQLEIEYWPRRMDGRRDVRRCDPRSSVTINGVLFFWSDEP
ncbi:hypothetical protein F4553_006315 [Allocatelliglobosispora scoriae]|uniref:Uncharacterized protein n=1 Tax=Allocatelliglobosispora scoriae TaxID=643052 RepID=A0A841C1Y6_9ACTN|nr:hypothetical protein [Allocatelliglobosispora scoriae]MBB5872881.1 hypothetical protein [Allocatelliglobosispora scoriae]